MKKVSRYIYNTYTRLPSLYSQRGREEGRATLDCQSHTSSKDRLFAKHVQVKHKSISTLFSALNTDWKPQWLGVTVTVLSNLSYLQTSVFGAFA